YDEEFVRLREEMVAGFRRHDEEITKLREDMMLGFKRHDEEITKLREDMIAGFKRHDEEFIRLREEMAAGFKRHDEEITKLREDMMLGFKRHDEEFVKLREEMMLGFKRHDEELARLRKDMTDGFLLMNRHLDAIGARWGLMAESAFREGLRGVLEKELGLHVEKWTAYDEKGYVHGYPSTVDIDLAVREGKTILVEVKSHVRRSDIVEFSRKTEFYALKTGKAADRKLMVSPYVEEEAMEAARNLGIEVYTKV
ncbi:MAG: DUF3782 domain-containing protein, partial [Candidatus Caldarchaeum sp.]|nr:DUF3782 domain-containing protein [Candidatus Caldarchaeum sp.]